MRKLLVVTIVGALTLVAWGCSSGDDGEGGAGETAGGVTAEAEVAAADEASAEDAVAVSQGAQGGGSLPSLGPSIVQTAALSVSVPRNEFDSAVQRARTIAAGAGGFVVSSSASQGEEKRLVRGTLVVRVPEGSYARVMERLTALGQVEAQEEAGQDVSQELVDLAARIRHLEAVEARLLGFLDDADSVAAALTVQSELNAVQLELEQVRGRERYLEDQVAFATISLELRERQVAVADGDGGGPWGIVDAWRAAGTGFVTVVGWLFVAAATLAPIALLLGVAILAARLAGWRGPSLPRRPSA